MNLVDDLGLYALVAAAALAAGVINSVAGGGTLLTFPALTFAGLNEVDANITSTLALMPGSAAGAWGFREEVRSVRKWLRVLLPPCVLGGFIGALLLTRLPPGVFALLVPWLILLATLLFMVQPLLTRWAGVGRAGAEPTRSAVFGVAAFQFLVAVYGGYFGAGIGILMLSSLAMMGIPTIAQMNALKTILAVAINCVAMVVFVFDGRVAWGMAAVMTVASIVGGYAGARVSRHLSRELMRAVIVAVGLALSAYFFAQQYANRG